MTGLKDDGDEKGEMGSEMQRSKSGADVVGK